MTSDSLPRHLSKFCFYCGTSLTYTEVDEAAKRASWECTGCGRSETSEWQKFIFKAVEQDESAREREIFDLVDQDNQSATNIELAPPDGQTTDMESEPFSLNYPLPPPPPPLPENRRGFSKQHKKEFLEYEKQYEALRRQIEADGIVAIIKAARIPLFALTDIQERFPYPSYSCGIEGMPKGTRQPIASFSLRYEGPNHPRNTERIAITQMPNEIDPESGIRSVRSRLFNAAVYIIYFLASLTGSEDQSMQALSQGRAIYQYVNHEAISRTPVISASIQAQTGEVLSWNIRRFNAPLPLIHAVAQIENVTIVVGAIGPAAAEIENLLGQLTRLTPESELLNQIDRGARAWDEYLQRYNRTLFDQT